jgi:hypothetical protein
MSVRKQLVQQALGSFQELAAALPVLTEDEVIACLELEAATLRRTSVIDRLISRAARLRELSYVAYLKEKFHGTPAVPEEHVQGRAQGRRRAREG